MKKHWNEENKPKKSRKVSERYATRVITRMFEDAPGSEYDAWRLLFKRITTDQDSDAVARVLREKGIVHQKPPHPSTKIK